MKKFLKWGAIAVVAIFVLAAITGGGKDGASDSSPCPARGAADRRPIRR